LTDKLHTMVNNIDAELKTHCDNNVVKKLSTKESHDYWYPMLIIILHNYTAWLHIDSTGTIENTQIHWHANCRAQELFSGNGTISTNDTLWHGTEAALYTGQVQVSFRLTQQLFVLVSGYVC